MPLIAVIIIASLIALDLLALRFGVDSRDKDNSSDTAWSSRHGTRP